MKISLFPFTLLFLLYLGTAQAAPSHPRYPVATGTFMQWYLVKDWTDAQWQSELRTLKEVGMHTLVLEPTVDSKAHTTYYPTHLPGYKEEDGYKDIVDSCLRNAEKAGFQVFLGLNFDETWWSKAANDPAWLYAQMDIGNAAADELYQTYFRRYPHAFHGWYWVWEVDNVNFRTPAQQEVLSLALNRNVRHLHALAPKLPVMLCPFMNSLLGTPNAYTTLWKTVFAHTDLGPGDIFCPQDCVGAGGLKLEQVSTWFAALREAVQSKPGLRFWSDTETFAEDDWTTAPINRLIAQLKAVEPYVEQSITFAYSHYDSPNIAAEGFHRTYRDYVWTGHLESTPPTDPTGLHGERMQAGGIRLQWEASTDDIGVCGYYVFRDNVRVSRMQIGKGATPPLHATFIDKDPPRNRACTYTVQAYDFAGNVSARLETVVP